MNRKDRINQLLRKYVGTKTHTATDLEGNAKEFFDEYFEAQAYLRENPDAFGYFPVKDDHLGRFIPWALRKGEGDRTVVFIHHTDTVDTDDFGNYQDAAYDIEEAEKLFLEEKLPLTEEIRSDLESGAYYFGRGASDMKGGGSIELTLLEEYMAEEDFIGNVLLLAVPDEESTSAGMRSAAYLMKELKDRYHLDYVLMIDAEPHERVDEEKITIYDGSIGKVMPLFLVRGKLAHGGQIYSGLNPIYLLSEIVTRTEIDPHFIESKGTTTSPGPTWFYLKDRKYVYDVSLPLYAGGYMSVLPLTKSPLEILEYLKGVSEEAFAHVIATMKERYKPYKEITPIDYGEMNFEPLVYTYDELVEKLKAQGDDSMDKLQGRIQEVAQAIQNNAYNYPEGGFQILEYALSLLKDKSPAVIIGIAPPFYSAVNNADLPTKDRTDDWVKAMEEELRSEFDMGLDVQSYFTGISDMSYSMFTESDATIDYIENNMLLWGSGYEIPLNLIKELSMPVYNIGPWGKDLHKYTERVLKEDLLERIPHLMDFITRKALEG